MTEELTNKLQAVHKGLADHARGCEGRNYSCDCGYDSELQELCGQAADAIARLTRELGEARAAEKSANGWYDKLERECQEVRRDLKKAEAERDKARAELAAAQAEAKAASWAAKHNYEGWQQEVARAIECRNKALEEANKAALDYGADETAGHSNRAVQHNTALGIANAIRALKTES